MRIRTDGCWPSADLGADQCIINDISLQWCRVGCRGLKTLGAFKTFRSPFGHFAPRLRLIIFADQTPLCSSLDLERASLRRRHAR